MSARAGMVSSRYAVLSLWACLVGSFAVLLPVGPSADAAGNGADSSQVDRGPKGGPGKAPPDPGIVYMSSGSRAPDRPAIRGVTLAITGDSVSASDTQLAKAMAGRDRSSIAWAPDGSRYAWIEGQSAATRKIMWASPGKAPEIVYQPADANDPYVRSASDGLAWGEACSGGGSLLVFTRESKWDADGQETEPQAIMGIDVGAPSPQSGVAPSHGQPRLLHQAYNTGRFAFSPAGHYLAFGVGYGLNERISILPVCEANPTPATLLGWEDFGAASYPYGCYDDPGSSCPCNGNSATVCYDYPWPAVQSVDWSGDGERLALSVTVGPDPGYPWRDLRVAYLQWDGSTYQKSSVKPLVFDALFGAASSEHSPQWGPSGPDDDCERLAFSQSGGASDGSTMNGRRLFLYDLVTSNSACFDGPREISARDPRAIDWK